VCKLKLERLVGTGGVPEDMFDADIDAPKPGKVWLRCCHRRRLKSAASGCMKAWPRMLAGSSWDGDRDSLS
jgi:hypothetical protein